MKRQLILTARPDEEVDKRIKQKYIYLNKLPYISVWKQTLFDFSSGDKIPSSGAKLFSNRLGKQHTETIFQRHTKIALFYKVCNTIYNGLIGASSLCVSTVNKGESRH